MNKAQIVAWRESGIITKSVAIIAALYLERYPAAAAHHALSFAQLRMARPIN